MCGRLEQGKRVVDMADKRTDNLYFRSQIGNHHVAGHGCVEDDYSERSGCRDYEKHDLVRFPHDNIKPEELNGEVIIVQKGRKKDGK